MKKILLLTLLIVFLSGCDIEYDVTFGKDGIINDNLYIEELQERFYETEPDEWGLIVASRIHTINIRNEFFEELATYEITLKNGYKNLDAYSNEEYVKKYGGNITLTESDEECKLIVYLSETLKYNLYGLNNIAPYMESLKVNVRFPYDVTQSNATSVNGDVYTWELSENSNLDHLSITYKNPVKTNETSKTAFDIIIVLIIVLFVVFIFIIKSKNKKNNAL